MRNFLIVGCLAWVSGAAFLGAITPSAQSAAARLNTRQAQLCQIDNSFCR